MPVSLLSSATSITTVSQLFDVVGDIISGITDQLSTLLTAITSNVFYIIPFAMALVGLSIRFFFKLFGR